MTPKKIILKTVGYALLLSLVATLPFFHDIITDKSGVKPWVPNFGIEESIKTVIKNEDGSINKIRYNGYTSYRTLIYFLLLHIFAAIGWMGWAKDARPGKPYKFFLLVPALMTLYTSLVILFDFRQTNFNEATTKIFIIIVVNFLLMALYLYRYYKIQNKKNEKNE